MPGGGATHNVARKMGRQRALEIVLSGQDFDADLAERYGFVNRAIDATTIDAFVSNLAHKIASYPSGGIAAIKKSVRAILAHGGQTPAGELADPSSSFSKYFKE